MRRLQFSAEENVPKNMNAKKKNIKGEGHMHKESIINHPHIWGRQYVRMIPVLMEVAMDK